jgi:putative lipoic acid-binding regulatory protein
MLYKGNIEKIYRKAFNMIDNRANEEASIDYPCEWIYKVIGSNKEFVHNAIASIIQDSEYHISDSNTSKTGKYQSFNVTVTVGDEAYRNKIYQAFKKHDDIKFVF